MWVLTDCHLFQSRIKRLFVVFIFNILQEAQKGIQAEEKQEAKMEDKPQKENFEIRQGENNNGEKELVAK